MNAASLEGPFHPVEALTFNSHILVSFQVRSNQRVITHKRHGNRFSLTDPCDQNPAYRNSECNHVTFGLEHQQQHQGLGKPCSGTSEPVTAVHNGVPMVQPSIDILTVRNTPFSCVRMQMECNMQRGQFGLRDAWAESPNIIAVQEQHDKAVMARVDLHMVKLTGFDAHGNAVQHASGFLYTKAAALIVTCSHVRYQPQSQPQELVARFVAQYVADGFEEEVHISTPPHPLYDLMALSGSRRASTNLRAGNPVTGDVVLVFGTPPDEVHVCHSKGTIVTSTPASLMVDAYADKGWSGGPVVNQRGRLVGVIARGRVDNTITQGVGNIIINLTEALSTHRLHDFLVGNNLPGLGA